LLLLNGDEKIACVCDDVFAKGKKLFFHSNERFAVIPFIIPAIVVEALAKLLISLDGVDEGGGQNYPLLV